MDSTTDVGIKIDWDEWDDICQHGETKGVKCKELVSFQQKGCGHTSTKFCFISEHHTLCHQRFRKLLACGHYKELECCQRNEKFCSPLCRVVQQYKSTTIPKTYNIVGTKFIGRKRFIH